MTRRKKIVRWLGGLVVLLAASGLLWLPLTSGWAGGDRKERGEKEGKDVGDKERKGGDREKAEQPDGDEVKDLQQQVEKTRRQFEEQRREFEQKMRMFQEKMQRNFKEGRVPFPPSGPGSGDIDRRLAEVERHLEMVLNEVREMRRRPGAPDRRDGIREGDREKEGGRERDKERPKEDGREKQKERE